MGQGLFLAERIGPAVVQLPGNGGFLVLGGSKSATTFYGAPVTVLQLQPAPRMVGAPQLSCQRNHLAAFQYQSTIWVVGGDAGGATGVSSLSSMEVSLITQPITGNTTKEELDRILKFKKFPIGLDISRAGHATVVVNDRFLIVIGGYTSSFLQLEVATQNTVEVWDLKQMTDHVRRGTTSRLKKSSIFCRGPSMTCGGRKFLGAAVLNRSNQIIVAGGQNHNVWHDTMEIISFNPNARCASEVFVERIAPGTTCKYAWEIHSQSIGIEQCNKIFSFSGSEENKIVAVGRSQARTIVLDNATATIMPQISSSTFAFKSPREFGDAAFGENLVGGPKILLLGGVGKRANEFLEGVSISREVPSAQRSCASHNISVPPYPTLPSAPFPSRNHLAEWRNWALHTQEIIRAYIDNDYLNWRKRQREAHQEKMNKHQGKIESLQKEIDDLIREANSMDLAHIEILESHDKNVQAWATKKEEEAKKTIQSFQRLLENERSKSEIQASSDRENAHPNCRPADEEGPPQHLCCPITTSLMKDPVMVVEDGQTYDRSAIEEWWNVQSSSGQAFTSPMTGPITSRQLAPNLLVRSQCREWEQQNPGKG